MTHESHVYIPAPSDQIRHVVMPVLDARFNNVPAESQVVAPIDPEQARAVESAFTGQPSDTEKAAAHLFGLWTGTAVLRDLALDMFSRSTLDEEDDVALGKPPDEPEKRD
jgi:hypothetical protein